MVAPERVWIGAIATGPAGKKLNSNFQNRTLGAYKAELGNSIVNFARLFRGGLLVFFPSYAALGEAVEHWRQRPSGGAQGKCVYDRLAEHKEVFVEPRRSGEFQDVMSGYYAAVARHAQRDAAAGGQSGAAFLAVCRGKVSEGLDFANDNGRAVVITGLPFAAYKSAKVVLKRQYLDARGGEKEGSYSKGLSGGDWYSQQASRAVNQAIGRVIRHKDDWGAILLCDERFGQPKQTAQFSKWLQPRLATHERFGPLMSAQQGSLREFFGRMSAADKAERQAAAAAKAAAEQRAWAEQQARAAEQQARAAARWPAASRGGGGGGGGGGLSFDDAMRGGGGSVGSLQQRKAASRATAATAQSLALSIGGGR